MKDDYEVLEELRNKLRSLNEFTPPSVEMDVYDKAMEIFLEAETNPEDGLPSFQELQSDYINLQIMLNQCESSKDRLGARIRKLQSTESYFATLNNRKIGIVGGHQTDVAKLKSEIKRLSKDPEVDFRETYDTSVPEHRVFREKYKHVDILVAFTAYTGHALTRHVKMVEKEDGVPVIWLEKAPSDIEQVLLDIQCILG